MINSVKLMSENVYQRFSFISRVYQTVRLINILQISTAQIHSYKLLPNIQNIVTTV